MEIYWAFTLTDNDVSDKNVCKLSASLLSMLSISVPLTILPTISFSSFTKHYYSPLAHIKGKKL